MRKFGVELEMNGISREKAVQVLRVIGINIQSESYNHQTRNHWKIVTDASVHNGFEVVSPPLTGEAGLEELRAVVTALKDAGGKVDRSCGFHVHFDAADLNVDHMRAIVTRYARFESRIDALMPPSRRGNAGRYCLSLARVVTDQRFCTAPNPRSLVSAQPGRYFKVNLQSYLVHGTVEFRQHSGTLDAPKAVNWVKFLAEFIEASKASVEILTVAPGPVATPQPAPANLRGVQARLAGMLRTNTQVSLTQIMEAFGWQAHSARAAICRLRQAGLNIVRRVSSTTLTYALMPGDSAPTPVSAPTVTTRITEPTAADDLFTGISETLRTFYRNRAAVLALA